MTPWLEVLSDDAAYDWADYANTPPFIALSEDFRFLGLVAASCVRIERETALLQAHWKLGLDGAKPVACTGHKGSSRAMPSST